MPWVVLHYFNNVKDQRRPEAFTGYDPLMMDVDNRVTVIDETGEIKGHHNKNRRLVLVLVYYLLRRICVM